MSKKKWDVFDSLIFSENVDRFWVVILGKVVELLIEEHWRESRTGNKI